MTPSRVCAKTAVWVAAVLLFNVSPLALAMGDPCATSRKSAACQQQITSLHQRVSHGAGAAHALGAENNHASLAAQDSGKSPAQERWQSDRIRSGEAHQLVAPHQRSSGAVGSVSK